MKTIHDSQHFLHAVQTSKTPGVPPGQIRIKTVRFATFEFPDGPDFDQSKWTILDANSEDARAIAHLVNMPPSFQGEFGLADLRQWADLRRGTPIKANVAGEIRKYLNDHGHDLDNDDLARCLRSGLFNELFTKELAPLQNEITGRALERLAEELARLAKDWETKANAVGIMRDMTSTTTARVLDECAKALKATLLD